MTSVINSSKINRAQLVDFVLVPIAIFSFCYLVFWTTGLLSSGFRIFVNDHLMITMNHDLESKGLFLAIKDWIVFDYNIGRFQPFYYIQAVILTIFFGLNATLWFGNACLLVSLAACFLFFFARFLEIPVLIALLFPGLTLIGAQAIMWAQPSNPQVIGMFLLSAALLFAAISTRAERHKIALNVVFILLVLLASLSKESFIIFIPALAVIKVWLHHRFKQVSIYQSVIQNLVVIAVLFGIAALEIIYIIFSIGVDGMGYAGVDENTLKFSNILFVVTTLLKRSHFEIFTLAIAFTLLIILWKRESFVAFVKQFFPAVLTFFLIVIPQIVLYAKSGIDGIYLIPATVGSALLTTYTLSLLSSRSKLLANFVLGLAIFIVCTEVISSWNAYSQMAKDSKNINGLLQGIQVCTPNNEPVLIALNPRVRYEAAVAMKTALNYAFERDNLVVATYGTEKTDFFSDDLQDVEKAWAFLDPQAITQAYDGKSILSFSNKSDIKAAVVFDNLDDDFLKTSSSWFNPNNYQVTSFPVSFASAQLYCKK